MRKTLALLLSLLFVFAACGNAFAGTVTEPTRGVVSGTCGNNLMWTLNTETGVLEITGTGNMTDWSSSNTPWYSNRSDIKTVVIGNGVTSIGNYAFYECSSLTSVNIPDGVTSIGNHAFGFCRSLTSVTIPDSVTSIGVAAFSFCTSLTSVTIPDSVTSIGTSAFSECSKLATVTIPDGVTDIGDSAFDKCTSLTSMTIPDSVTSIGERAFYKCSSLTTVTIGNGVTSIGWSTFKECTSLTSVTIPDGVTSIVRNAFSNCTSLTTVTIGNGVTSIGDEAFYNCTSLAFVTIPDSVTSIGNEAFYNCTSLASVTIGNGVTSIGNSAFSGCSLLTSVTIGNSVTSIGYAMFSGCSSLTTLTIPDSVTSIGSSAFKECTSLTSVTIGNGVTSIGNSAFYKCSSLTSVVIPDSVTSIGNSAFSNCTSLTSVTIPDSVTSIGGQTFGWCRSLTSVTIPDSVTSIGAMAFLWCGSLTSVTIGNGVTSIGEEAFSNCGSLTTVTIGNSVTSIGNRAFAGCSSLTSVVIPDSVTNIGHYTFSNCASLTSAGFPGAPPSLFGTYVFDNCAVNFCIYYTAAHASEWSPNGETTWNGYPIAHGGFVTVSFIGAYNDTMEVFPSQNVTLPVFDGEGVHYTFTVNGEPWDGTNITEDVTVEVGLDINVYDVMFRDSITNTVISTEQVRHGEPAAAPEPPEHYGYSFVGWDKDFSCVKNDITVNAVYERVAFTVTYVGAYTGTEQVLYGGNAVLPEYGESYGHYIFTVNGELWDGTNITCDVTVEVGLEINMYKVTFYDTLTGEVIEEQMVPHGEAAIPPTPPEHYGYTFIEWQGDYSCVTEDVTVSAVYAPHKFVVKFTDGKGNTLSTQLVAYLTAATEPEPPYAEPGEIFVGWDADFSCITGDTVINAVWEYVTVCTVTFTGAYTGTVVVNYGEDCELPVYPSQYLHYTFMVDGEYWDGECVTSDVTVVVSAAANSIDCTVVFVDWDGTVLSTQTVRYGNPATPPEDPTREGCVFTGWSKNLEFIAHDVTIKAVYAKGPDYLAGDVDCDGLVTMADVTILAMYLNGENPQISVLGMLNADANDEWKVDVRDIAAIYKIITNS